MDGRAHVSFGYDGDQRTTLKDTVLMRSTTSTRGGLLGKKVEAVVGDPRPNWPLLCGKAAN